MFILTERTPNPDAMKFTPHVQLTDGASFSFSQEDFADGASALAARLFALAGVSRVYIGPEFVTVTRARGGPPWATLRFPAIAAIADHLETGEPAVAQASSADAQACDGSIEAEIRNVLARHVQPGVARDGGEILFDRFEPATGVVWIRMQGACGGCPSARLTLKAGVETILRRYVPEVLGVEESAGEAVGPPAAARLKTWLAGLGGRDGPPQRPRFTHGGKDMARRVAPGDPPAAPASAGAGN